MLTIGMMVKNEQEYIDRSIDFIKQNEYEYSIYDTGSNDKTLSILQNRMINYRACSFTNYADVRNIIIDGISGDYLLMLDGDETITERIVIPEEKYNLYKVTRCHYLGNGCIYYDKTLRLYRNNRKVRYVGELYEYANISSEDIGQANILIHHFGYLKKTFINKAKNNLEQIQALMNKDARAVFYSMQALYLILLGDYLEVENTILQGKERTSSIWFFILLSDLKKIKKEYKRALSLLDEAEIFANRSFVEDELCFYLSRINAKRGIIYMLHGDYDNAQKHFECIDDTLAYCRDINLLALYKKKKATEKVKEFEKALSKYCFESDRNKPVSFSCEVLSDCYSERLEDINITF